MKTIDYQDWCKRPHRKRTSRVLAHFDVKRDDEGIQHRRACLWCIYYTYFKM